MVNSFKKKIFVLTLSIFLFSCSFQPNQTSSNSSFIGLTKQTPTFGQVKSLDLSGVWKEVVDGDVLNSKLYTIEKDGFLYETVFPSIAWKSIGEANFKTIKTLFTSNSSLYGIDNDGTIFKIGITDASKTQVGDKSDLKNVVDGDAVNDKLYTVEKDGNLFETNLNDGTWKIIGTNSFKETKYVFDLNSKLYIIEKDGSLFNVNLVTGEKSSIGQKGDWGETTAFQVVNGKLYSIESNGFLYETDVNTGNWQKVGNINYSNYSFLFSGDKRLFAINKNGSLFEISLK